MDFFGHSHDDGHAPAEEIEVDVWLGMGLAVVAGLATVLGVVFIPLSQVMEKKRLTGAALGFAAGVMLWVAFMEALGEEAVEHFEEYFEHRGDHDDHHDHDHDDDDHTHGMAAMAVRSSFRRLHAGEPLTDNQLYAQLCVAGFFFLGIAMTVVIDRLTDKFVGGAEGTEVEMGGGTSQQSLADGHHDEGGHSHVSLKKVSLVTFIALTLHNFPEGLATFFSASVGNMGIVFAVAMHNIPEGAAIAIPLYQSTGSYVAPVVATFIAGLAQPLGALVGLVTYWITGSEFNDFLFGAMFSATAGIMIAISILGLLPEAFKLADPLFVSLTVFAGFAVMEATLIIFGVVGMEDGVVVDAPNATNASEIAHMLFSANDW